MTRERPRRFCVVGRAGIDLAPEPAGEAIAAARTFSAALGGSAANIAVGLARLGKRVDLVSVVADDPTGEFCLAQLDAFGVGTSHVHRAPPPARTSLALTEAQVEGHRTIIYRNDAADLALSPVMIVDLQPRPGDTLVITGTALSREPSRSACFAAREAFSSAGCEVVLDLDFRPASWASDAEAANVLGMMAANSDTVVGNDEEFGLLAKRGETSREAARIIARMARLVVHKEGASGLVAFAAGETIHAGIWPTNPLKPTGAGDAFLAALLAAREDGATLSAALLRGAASASIVVSRPHCAPAMPDAGTLEAFMAGHPNPPRITIDAHSAP